MGFHGYFHADTWDESQRLVTEQQALLLTDDAEQVFGDLLQQYADDADVTRLIETHRALLCRCRNVAARK